VSLVDGVQQILEDGIAQAMEGDGYTTKQIETSLAAAGSVECTRFPKLSY
jgi:hypothetical protein